MYCLSWYTSINSVVGVRVERLYCDVRYNALRMGGGSGSGGEC